MRLFGKGGKERLVPLGSYAQRALEDYIVRARPKFASHGKGTAALFLNLVQGGADIRVVQELLGHASIATTQVYTKVTPEGMLEVYRMAHPRAQERT